MDVAQRAALAFHTVAVEVLGEQLDVMVQLTVARIVGESPELYASALHGRFGTLERVRCWIARWAAAGHPELELCIEPHQVSVRRAEPRGSERPHRGVPGEVSRENETSGDPLSYTPRSGER